MLEFLGYFFKGLVDFYLMYPAMSIMFLYLILFIGIGLYISGYYSATDIAVFISSLVMLLSFGLLFYQVSALLLLVCAIVAAILPKITQDLLLNPATAVIFLAIIFAANFSNSFSTIKIYFALSGFSWWLACGVAICAGIGFALLYIDGVSAWLNKNYNQRNEKKKRFLHYKKSGQSFDLKDNDLAKFIAIRFVLHKMKKRLNDQADLGQIENKINELSQGSAKYLLKRKLYKLRNRNSFIRGFAKYLGTFNYVVANPVITMLGGALLVGSIFGSVSGVLLMVSAAGFFLAGAFLAYAASMPFLRKLASRFEYWLREPEFDKNTIIKIILSGFVILASTSNAYYSGVKLLAQFKQLVGASSSLGVLLAQAPAWLPVFIGLCVALITFFIAIAVYYSAIDAKFASNFQPSKLFEQLREHKVASLFSVVAAAGLGVYFYHRLFDVLTTVVGAGWIVSVISAVAVVLMFVNFFLSIQDKLTKGNSLGHASEAFVDSSDLKDCEKIVNDCNNFFNSEEFLKKFEPDINNPAK